MKPAFDAPSKMVRALEGALCPTVQIGGRSVSTFQIFGVLGFAAATGAALAVGARQGLSLALLAALVPIAAGTFFAVVLVTRAIVGEERLVYYHHEVAVLAVAAGTAAAFGRPVLPYLDVAIVALGVFLFCGRIGCAMVGCCHGRPHRLGLRYRPEHAHAGFARWLVDIPLLPVQLIESIAVLALTTFAVARLSAGAPPGAVLSSQLIGYGALRFVLEFARGDLERPRWAGFSEAQWISVAFVLGTVGAELTGWLPFSRGDLFVAAILGIALGLVIAQRRGRDSAHELLAPAHVSELAHILSLADAAAAERGAAAVTVFTTTLGVRVSYGPVAGGARVYTFSGVEAAAARALSSVVTLLRPSSGRVELLERRPGLFQMLVTPGGQAAPDGSHEP